MENNEFREHIKHWLTQVIHRSMPVLRRHSGNDGLSMSHFGAMGLVIERGFSTVSEIANEMGVSNAAASQIIDRLVHDEMLIRMEDPNDRRVKHLVITKKGQEFMHEKFKGRIKKFMILLDALSDEELVVVQQGFSIIKNKIEELQEKEIL